MAKYHVRHMHTRRNGGRNTHKHTQAQAQAQAQADTDTETHKSKLWHASSERMEGETLTVGGVFKKHCVLFARFPLVS